MCILLMGVKSYKMHANIFFRISPQGLTKNRALCHHHFPHAE